MIRSILSILFLFCTVSLHGQNLILNSGFEVNDYEEERPQYGLGGVINHNGNCTNWYKIGTADYFNICDSVRGAASIGNAVIRRGCGAAAITYGGEREYLIATLADPLLSGRTYDFVMYIQPSFNSHMMMDDLGAFFFRTLDFKTLWEGAHNYTIEAQIMNPEYKFLYRKDNWAKLKGSFVAKGGEQHVMIGRFRTNEELHVKKIRPRAKALYECYLFIDDVCLVSEGNRCDPKKKRKKAISE